MEKSFQLPTPDINYPKCEQIQPGYEDLLTKQDRNRCQFIFLTLDKGILQLTLGSNRARMKMTITAEAKIPKLIPDV